MISAPIPEDEQARLKALESLNILDTPPEERFDRIVRITKNYFKIPIVIISLVDRDRQWFKACYGLEAKQTGRDVSFCAHAILSPDLMVVGDASKDERFADNPLVTGDPFIRFYAGMPVIGPGGKSLGTLCMIDQKPRTLSHDESQALKDFASWVEMELNSKQLSEVLNDVKIKNNELERMNQTMIGRELKMAELKNEIKLLKENLS